MYILADKETKQYYTPYLLSGAMDPSILKFMELVLHKEMIWVNVDVKQIPQLWETAVITRKNIESYMRTTGVPDKYKIVLCYPHEDSAYLLEMYFDGEHWFNNKSEKQNRPFAWLAI